MSTGDAGYVGEQLAIERNVFDPLDPKVADIPTSLNLSPSERIAFMPALGLHFDNAYTPNVIFTYRKKKKRSRCNRSTVIFWGLHRLPRRMRPRPGLPVSADEPEKEAVAKLETRLAQFSPQSASR